MTLRALNSTNFLPTVTATTPTLICFTSASQTQYHGCKEIFATTASNHSEMTFATVELDDNRSLAQEFNIRAVPTFMLFCQGIVLFSCKGALSFAELENLIASANNIDINEVRTEIRKLGE